MILGSFWKKATSPMEAEPQLSKMGSQVVPAFTDLKTPPEAVATRTWVKSLSSASKSEMRPTMLAGPIERQRRCRTRSAGFGPLPRRGLRRRERAAEGHDDDEDNGSPEGCGDAVLHTDLLGFWIEGRIIASSVS